MHKNKKNISENNIFLLKKPEKISPRVNYVAVVSEGKRFKRKVFPHRTFADWQMQLVLSGEIEYEAEVSGEKISVRSGEIALMPPGIRHTQIVTSVSGFPAFDCVHFLFNSLGEIPFPLKGVRVFRPDEPELIHFLFSRLKDVFQKPGIFAETIASGIVREIFLRLFLTEPGEETGKSIGNMTRFLDSVLKEHPGRAELAGHFHCAPGYVNALFRKNLGVSPGVYVRQKLARTAYSLLLRGDSGIKEIAEMLGFKNQFHFSRVFRKIYGVSPASVRKMRSQHFS